MNQEMLVGTNAGGGGGERPDCVTRMQVVSGGGSGEGSTSFCEGRKSTSAGDFALTKKSGLPLYPLEIPDQKYALVGVAGPAAHLTKASSL